jgi:hypothetical protein
VLLICPCFGNPESGYGLVESALICQSIAGLYAQINDNILFITLEKCVFMKTLLALWL